MTSHHPPVISARSLVKRFGDVEAVRAAASDNSELDRPDNWGRTPLIVALQQGRTALVEMLVGRGASVSATDAWGRTPLLVATQLKNTAAIRLLLALIHVSKPTKTNYISHAGSSVRKRTCSRC
mgnify:CR=1 FL=1